MESVSAEQIRQYRLHAHHLDRWYGKDDIGRVVGACGMQNTPPGAWESALHNRIADLSLDEMKRLLEVERTLLQAWSFRGTPVVFPTAQSSTFLSALVAQQGEPWIYTQGIQLALDILEMSFDELLHSMKQVMPKLTDQTIRSKTALDQTLADYMLPILPDDKRNLWNKPSMYGSPDKQTIGGAVVSFLLRPCSFMGLVVFGKREGGSPTFTSYEGWVGEPLKEDACAEAKLVRTYLHCYGPASVSAFAAWLGSSLEQAQRLWQTVTAEIEPITAEGRTCYVLTVDKERLSSPPLPERTVHLLTGHDPYLGLQDRAVILEDKTRQKRLWQTVSNPGAVLWQGKAVGFWKGKRKGRALEIEVTLWDCAERLAKELRDECESYAAFQQLALHRIEILS